jgi:nucleoside phosphorylase/DNA-binding NarL/FixJ family response regulator
MKILLVDDEFEKSQSIIAALVEAGLGEDNLLHRSNSREARLLLQQTEFDLILIDLNLPEMLGTPPKPDGGLEFFDQLMLDGKIKLPKAVLFITAKEELINKAELEAHKRGAQLCLYSSAETRWKSILLSKIRYLSVQQERAGSTYPRADIAIITALRSELTAVSNLPYDWKPIRYPNNPVSYNHGYLDRDDGKRLTFVAASAYSKGMPSSAALATQLCMLFKPKYLVMLGICAGIKKETELGHVIVADPTWDWGSGKVAEDDGGERVFLMSPQQRPLSSEIRELCVDLSSDPKVLKAIRMGWDSKVPEGELKVQVGPMASGASVLANDDAVKAIAVQNRDVIAIEMEAYAVMAAAEYALHPTPIAMAIKSVCDFADANKGKDWQDYAAYTSATFFDQLVRSAAFPV